MIDGLRDELLAHGYAPDIRRVDFESALLGALALQRFDGAGYLVTPGLPFDTVRAILRREAPAVPLVVGDSPAELGRELVRHLARLSS